MSKGSSSSDGLELPGALRKAGKCDDDTARQVACRLKLSSRIGTENMPPEHWPLACDMSLSLEHSLVLRLYGLGCVICL